MNETLLLSTDEAAEMLGVKPETIYTYVSRGRLESIRKPGAVASWFRQEDIERLALSRYARKAVPAPQPPGIETAITDIDGNTYRYRGHEPQTLVRSHTYEQVAELLWTGHIPDERHWPTAGSNPTPLPDLDPEALPLDRLRVAISILAAADHLRFGRPPEALVVTARQLISDMVETLGPLGDVDLSDTLAGCLWTRLSPSSPSSEQLAALDAALIMIADHSVAPTTLAARIAASYGADLYGCVETGLAVLAGAWHGGRALSAESMLESIERVGDAEVVVGELYRTGGIPCLGQPRYIGSDPRTNVILEVVEAAMPDNPASRAFEDVRRITRERALPGPSVELALATLSRAFGFTKGASEAIFAIGRTAGWIAHAMEVYGRPDAGPPDFTYVGAGEGQRS